MQRLPAAVEDRIRIRAGAASDAAVAAEVGCSPGAVARVRRLAGIASWRRAPDPLVWPEERLALIGAMADGVLARRWGISRTAVQAKRLEMGRPACNGRVTRMFLSPAVRRRLGQESDAVLAACYKVSIAAVRMARRCAGIPGTRRVQRVVWTPAMIADLALLPTSAFCEKYSVSNRTVALKRGELGCPGPRPLRSSRWTAERLARLGTTGDRELAEEWQMSEEAVRKRRARLGLPAWDRHRALVRRNLPADSGVTATP